MNAPNQHNLQDRTEVRNVLSGDPGAFAIIIKNTEGLVAQIVSKMINNREDRKDIAQDVYLKAYNSLKTFRFESKLSTWIARIAYNTCINHLDKKKLVIVDEPVLHNHAANNDAGWLLDLKERTAIITAAIDQLPPVLKTLITLYHHENLSYAEIQVVTDFPEGTIKSYLFRARKALKDNLLQYYKREEI